MGNTPTLASVIGIIGLGVTVVGWQFWGIDTESATFLLALLAAVASSFALAVAGTVEEKVDQIREVEDA